MGVKRRKGARGKENAKRRRSTWIVTTRVIPTVMLQELSIYKTATDWGGHGFLDHFDSAPLDSDEDMSKAPSKARGKSGGRPGHEVVGNVVPCELELQKKPQCTKKLPQSSPLVLIICSVSFPVFNTFSL